MSSKPIEQTMTARLSCQTAEAVKTGLTVYGYSPELMDTYAQLVANRRECTKCMGHDDDIIEILDRYDGNLVSRKLPRTSARPEMVNPWSVSGDGQREYGSCRLGPWEHWQGRLDSPIVVVGQDFSSVDYYLEVKGVDDHGSTNQNLVKSLRMVGIKIPEVSKTVAPSDHRLFFTNAALCLKIASMSNEVDPRCYENCGPFLRRTLDLAPRKLVITLGRHATLALRRLFDSKPCRAKLSDYISKYSGPRQTGTFHHWATYHPSRRSVKAEEHWVELRKWIREEAQMAWAKPYLSDI